MNPTKVHALCPYCGSTIQVRADDTIRYHRGPNPACPQATYCRKGVGTDTTEWPEHTDEQGRVVRTHPGEFKPGRLVTSAELWELIYSPEWITANPHEQRKRLDRFEVRVKGADQ
ncbi:MULTISPECIES: hypothetical protein [unclassified Nocardiopsis]|uniref:hypothetical protein n=1 Tax=Nocardiopsis TaxID=2013 RepID=UPI00387B7FC8